MKQTQSKRGNYFWLAGHVLRKLLFFSSFVRIPSTCLASCLLVVEISTVVDLAKSSFLVQRKAPVSRIPEFRIYGQQNKTKTRGKTSDTYGRKGRNKKDYET